MIIFKKVLVCVNLSDSAQNIIKESCNVAKRLDTFEVTFLYVVKDFNLPESLREEFPDLVEKAMEERKNEINKLINESFHCGKQIETKLLIRQGNLTKEILSVADEEGTDLIVIGRRQESDSVLNTRIARRATCSLLIVPKNKKLSKFDKIHIPVDFSNYTKLSLDSALKLTEGGRSEIFLHNVYSVPSSYRYSGKSYDEFAAILEKHTAKDLEKLSRQLSISEQRLTPIHTNDNGQNVIDIIYQEAHSGEVDLIVMGAKGRTLASAIFIGSKAERMIQINNDIPLMVIRPKGSNAGILESLQEF